MPTDEPLPGVEIEDVPSGVRPIAGVSTSTALFIGQLQAGPLQKPVFCQTAQDFEDEFADGAKNSELARAIRFFFANGGTGCYVFRIGRNTGGTEADGSQTPQLSDYLDAFELVDREVELFNLLILPQDATQNTATQTSLWGPASEFCRKRRALLLLDPLPEWTSVEKILDPAQGLPAVRAGLAREHCVLHYPRVRVAENGGEVALGASGVLAGLLGRMDSSRGVWKAPAGTEADLRGLAGLALEVSEEEHTRLNAMGVNALRTVGGKLVSWGARTLAGDDQYGGEYKYLSVKRTALFLEESLRRGLQWTVFEPNDEPLWARIRASVQAFMHTLFQQGAFQGSAPGHAYFVRCDTTTTTAADRAQGRVNLQVGFAPLKPAEFVIISMPLRAALGQ
ncbi:MAG: DUF2586 family protein [candidate division FCPU426 bacterium]